MRGWSAALGVALLLWAPGVASADDPAGEALKRTLDVELANPAVNGSAGVYVYDTARQEALYAFHPSIARTLASNTKLFTASAALGTFGPDARLTTRAVADGTLGADGVLTGDLYLIGMGDPTFGTAATIATRYEGVGAKVEDLLDRIQAAGVKRVTGRVLGDASRFDNDRGPSNGESALTFDRGVRASPELYAAQQLTNGLEARGIDVTGTAATGKAPATATPVAAVESPTIAQLVKLMNKPSDNFFAEMLLRNLAAAAGQLGTTEAGSVRSELFARGLGVSELDQVDGSGLNSGNVSTPAAIVGLLDVMRRQHTFDAFYDSLPIAGRDGTLADRMIDTPAMDRCRAKTGTLGSTVSSLSGYCRHEGGHLVLFSILMNRTTLTPAREAQDRMTSAIASYSAATVGEIVDEVSVAAPAGGAVPATLSLTLGAPANFGTFTPGVARVYEAGTTANAVSTAGDAALTVADPAGTGRLANGDAALPRPLEVRANDRAFTPLAGTTTLLTFGGPISNDAVQIGFRQAIDGDTPLRTGRYETELVFTLSTTTP